MTDWTTLAAKLADDLTAAGKLRSPEWQAAVRAVPRHELVPVHYMLDPHTRAWTQARTVDDLEGTYSNTALFVMPDGLSSTSMPGLMTRMLEALDVHDKHRVLEIGAGTGYNAALLCHWLGDEHVFGVDIEPELVDLARDRLAGLGYHPTLVAVDGEHGLAEHAPYDRIIATCSVPAVPWPWVEQTREGGLILVDVKTGRLAGNLVLLRRHGDRAEGRFDPTYGSFMPMRHRGLPDLAAHRSHPPQDRAGAAERTTTLELTRPWEHTVLWWLAHFVLPAGTSFSLRGDGHDQPLSNTVLSSPDGSWCEVREDAQGGVRHVREAGPTKLWIVIEDTHRLWTSLGEPGWESFGLTVTRDRQWVWLDHPGRPHAWPLPDPTARPPARPGRARPVMMGLPRPSGRLCTVAMAAILASMPDVWQRVLADHVADQHGRCRECRNAAGVSAPWPCMSWEIAEEARRVHQGEGRPAGRHAR